MNQFGRNLALWVIIGLLLIAVFNLFQSPNSGGPQSRVAFSEFLGNVEGGKVADVTIQGQNIQGHFSDGRAFSTYAPYDPNLVDKLTKQGVRISALPPEESTPSLLGVLLSWFPILLLIGVWIFFMRQMQSGGGKAMGFGKSRAKLLTEKVGRVTFEDVAGIEEAKQELEEVVISQDPQKFQRLGGKIPKGVLLVGLLARARRCWRAPLRAKPTRRSSPFVSDFRRNVRRRRCRGCAICSNRARRTRSASSSSTKSMLSAVIAAPGRRRQ